MIKQALTALVSMTLATSLASQVVRVEYGDGPHGHTITRPGQVDQFALLNAKKGDALRVAFGSQFNRHYLTVTHNASRVTQIIGAGVATAILKSAGTYLIQVQARNGTDGGPYGFELDRLNDPVGGDRIAFGWNMTGTINAWGSFAIYDVHASAGAKAQLSLGSQFNRMYAEVVDPRTAKQLCAVTGSGTATCTFPTKGTYAIFVKARNCTDSGWFGVSLLCQSFPCDCTAYAGSYGKGWPTSNPPTLTASAPPRLGSTIRIQVGNSTGRQTEGVLLIGVRPARVAPLGTGTLLVEAAGVLLINSLPANGASLPFPVPTSRLWCGTGLALQTVLVDSKVNEGFVFSAGLHLNLGT